MGWRDIKSAAKAVIHATFQVPALYLADRAGTPVPCSVRLHDKVQAVGMGSVDGYNASTLLETQPKAIFNAAEVPNPLPKAYLFVSAIEVYRLGPAEPPVAGFIMVALTQLDATACQAIIASSGVDLSVLETESE